MCQKEGFNICLDTKNKKSFPWIEFFSFLQQIKNVVFVTLYNIIIFLGLVITKSFLEMLNFLQIFFFKGQNLRKLQGGQNKKSGENLETFLLQDSLIDNIIITFYNWRNIMFHHLCKKKELKNVAKNLIMVKVYGLENLSKKFPTFITKIP